MLSKFLLLQKGTIGRQTAATNHVAASAAACCWSSSSSSSSAGTTTATTAGSAAAASSPVFAKIACIGTGTICQALVEPMIRTQLQPANHFTMYDVNLKALHMIAEKFPGVQTATSIAQAVEDADVILLAVKPQNLTERFFAEFQAVPTFNKAIVLSVIAGKTMDCFLDAGFKKVVRSMPNTPAIIGEGMTVWSATNNLNAKERSMIDKMLSCCGATVRDTSLMDDASMLGSLDSFTLELDGTLLYLTLVPSPPTMK
jgi:NADP oxidoreductase coenzyme F420-dependent